MTVLDLDTHFEEIVDALTRRGLLAGGLGAAAVLGLAACGSSDGHGARSTGGSRWAWTDATGRSITRDGTPERLVVTGGLLESLWDFGLRPVGCLGMKPTAEDHKTSLSRIPMADLDTITFCGGADGVDAEKVLALQPDLVLAEWDKPSKTYWGFGNAQRTATQIGQVCPVGGVDITGTAPQLLGRMRELAVRLGAEASGQAVTGAVAAFQRAAQDLRQAIAAKPGLRVALMGGDKTGASFGNPQGMTDLAYYRQLGLHLVLGPQAEDTGAATVNYWSDTISWERIGDYPVDLLLLTANSEVSVYEAAATYRRLPAVVAHQTAFYAQLPAPSYLTYAEHLQGVAKAVRAARRVA